MTTATTATTSAAGSFDFDVLVIGSGFGGAVSAVGGNAKG